LVRNHFARVEGVGVDIDDTSPVLTPLLKIVERPRILTYSGLMAARSV
jgi:hypothetical protein